MTRELKKEEQVINRVECACRCMCLYVLSKYCFETTLPLIEDELFLALKSALLIMSLVRSFILYVLH